MRIFKKFDIGVLFIILLIIFNISACGGGGSSSKSNPDPDPDTTAPTFVSAVVNNSSPTKVRAEFSEPVTIDDSTGFTITVESAEATITGAAGNDSEIIIFTLATAVQHTETVTIEYDGTGNAADLAGNPLAEFPQNNVTNNVANLFVPEGSITTPVDLGSLPAEYSGSVGEADDSASYYSIAVTSGQSYIITLTDLFDNADLYVFTDSGFSALYPGGFSANSGNTAESVTVTANSGTLYIEVTPFNISGIGTFFTLSVEVNYESEGTTGDPFELGTVLPPIEHIGCVSDSVNSFYSFDIISLKKYRIRLTGLDDNADLYVYSDPSYSTLYTSGSSTNSGTADESVTIEATGYTIYVKVNSNNLSGDGTYYTLSVDLYCESEGTIPSPVALGSAPPENAYDGCVSSSADSYYSISIGNTGRRYRVRLTSLLDNADLYVYSDSSFTTLYTNGSSENAGTTDETLELDTTGSTLYIRVHYPGTGSGTYYTIIVNEIFYHEGTVPAPVNFSSLPLNEITAVDSSGNSYYSIDITGDIYTVNLSDISDNINLAVYSNSQYTNLLMNPLAIVQPTTAASVDVASVLSSKIYIRVSYNGSGSGAYFKLSVSEYTNTDKTVYYISTFDNAAAGLTGEDTSLYLVNSVGELLIFNNNGGLAGSGFSEIVYPFTSGSTYYLSVRTASNAEGRYSIRGGTSRHNGSASSGTPSNPDSAEDADDDPVTAPTLNINTTYDRTIDLADDITNGKSDYFKIIIP